MDKQMDSLPGWSHEEEKPAPMPLLLVQGFVNTLDLETGTDVLTDAEEARSWLISAGLLNRRAEIAPADLTFAREVRESIRSVLAADGDVDPGELRSLRALANAHRARLSVTERGVLALENPRREDVGDALFELLLIVHAAQRDGTWKRLKTCANPECAWAFYDRSRNQQGSWCEMAVCGNRLKNRQFRARRR
ncbi:MAG TPA: CGNR zinc finger domain-containing protein [Solirubrobacteraceae bacterium]|jgi:predicted RNA-binding Zn ribbon-like protein|nr:CGNR zinc finger domain-containing protein [Solirubrobacteraceae bacterium]